MKNKFIALFLTCFLFSFPAFVMAAEEQETAQGYAKIDGGRMCLLTDRDCDGSDAVCWAIRRGAPVTLDGRKMPIDKLEGRLLTVTVHLEGAPAQYPGSKLTAEEVLKVEASSLSEKSFNPGKMYPDPCSNK